METTPLTTAALCLLGGMLSVTTGCTAHTPPAPLSAEVTPIAPEVITPDYEHIGSFNISCDLKRTENTWDFGGISAISYRDGTYHMMTEGHPYVFQVSMDLHDPRPALNITGKTVISDGDRREELSKIEAMAACHDHFILGTEGIPAEELSRDENQDIRLFMTDMAGAYVQDIALPEAFVLHGEARGAVLYRGIQGLSCSPDGGALLLSLQLPLIQDGGPAPGPIRNILFSWDEAAETFLIDRIFYVDIDHDLGIMGSELIDNEGDAILLASRSEPEVSNTLFRVDTRTGDDIIACSSLLEGGDCPDKAAAPKTLVVDRFERYSGQDLRAHEVQYDAIGIGPPTEDGRATLLIATDDDHCGAISNPMATQAPGFSGTTFTIIALD